MVIASCLCFVWCFVDPKLNKLSPNATSTVLWVNFVVLLTHFVAPEGKFFNETTTQQHSSQTWSIPKWIIFGRLRQFPVKHYKGKQLSRKAIRNNPNVRKNKGKWSDISRSKKNTSHAVKRLTLVKSFCCSYFPTSTPGCPVVLLSFRPRSPIWSVVSVHETCLAVHP